MKCTCYPEMKKTIMYNIRTTFEKSSDVVIAACGCPAGLGPTCSCKYYGAFCYFIKEFCRNRSATALYASSTSSLQHCMHGISHERDPQVLIQLRALNSLKLSMEKMVNE